MEPKSGMPDLNNSDRMYCETYSCSMLKDHCITRQKNARIGPGSGQYWKPGASDINCMKCEQGQEIAKQYKNRKEVIYVEDSKSPVTKVCSHIKCEHNGKPQTLDSFDNDKKAKDGKYSYCKDCRRRMQRRSRLKKKAEKPPEPKQTTCSTTKDKPYIITIDFTHHPEVYNDLIDLAHDKIRTPEAQALFILKSIYDAGKEV